MSDVPTPRPLDGTPPAHFSGSGSRVLDDDEDDDDDDDDDDEDDEDQPDDQDDDDDDDDGIVDGDDDDDGDDEGDNKDAGTSKFDADGTLSVDSVEAFLDRKFGSETKSTTK